MQSLIKKLDKAVRGFNDKQATIDERVQIRLALKSILTCLQLFPSSMKQIVSGKQLTTSSKDNVTVIIENVVR